MKYFFQSFQTYPEGMTDPFCILYEELKYLEGCGFSNYFIATSSDFIQTQSANEIILTRVRR